MLFTIFVRYLAFVSHEKNDLRNLKVTNGTWPAWLNALFNATFHYIFIASVILIFMPIFAGKLSLLRDIYSAAFFRPFARISFTFACFQGLLL